MNNMDTVSLVAMLFAAYGKTEELERQKMYVMMLGDIHVELLNMTVSKLIRESVFLPTIAEIIATSKELYLAKNPELRQIDFDEAWQEVQRAMSNYGYDRKPDFEHPEVAQMVKVIGWRNLCTAPEAYSGAMQHRAEEVFRQIVKRKASDAKNGYYLGTNKNVLGLENIKELVHGVMHEIGQKNGQGA